MLSVDYVIFPRFYLHIGFGTRVRGCIFSPNISIKKLCFCKELYFSRARNSFVAKHDCTKQSQCVQVILAAQAIIDLIQDECFLEPYEELWESWLFFL